MADNDTPTPAQVQWAAGFLVQWSGDAAELCGDLHTGAATLRERANEARWHHDTARDLGIHDVAALWLHAAVALDLEAARRDGTQHQIKSVAVH